MGDPEEDKPEEMALPAVFDGACCMCFGVDNEHLIILCDNPGCARETHMYCMWPAMTEVPEGEWLCDLCDPAGSSKHLESFLQSTIDHRNAVELSTREDYDLYIQSLVLPLDLWTPFAEPPAHEFDITSLNLLGSKVTVYCPLDHRHHLGRIISRRQCAAIGRWEHRVLFKSGKNGRNRPVIAWVDLQEHASHVFGGVGWIKKPGTPYSPGQRVWRSSKVAADAKGPRLPIHYLFQEDCYVEGGSDGEGEIPFAARSLPRSTVAKAVVLAYFAAQVEDQEQTWWRDVALRISVEHLDRWALQVDSVSIPFDLSFLPIKPSVGDATLLPIGLQNHRRSLKDRVCKYLELDSAPTQDPLTLLLGPGLQAGAEDFARLGRLPGSKAVATSAALLTPLQFDGVLREYDQRLREQEQERMEAELAEKKRLRYEQIAQTKQRNRLLKQQEREERRREKEEKEHMGLEEALMRSCNKERAVAASASKKTKSKSRRPRATVLAGQGPSVSSKEQESPPVVSPPAAKRLRSAPRGVTAGSSDESIAVALQPTPLHPDSSGADSDSDKSLRAGDESPADQPAQTQQPKAIRRAAMLSLDLEGLSSASRRGVTNNNNRTIKKRLIEEEDEAAVMAGVGTQQRPALALLDGHEHSGAPSKRNRYEPMLRVERCEPLVHSQNGPKYLEQSLPKDRAQLQPRSFEQKQQKQQRPPHGRQTEQLDEVYPSTPKTQTHQHRQQPHLQSQIQQRNALKHLQYQQRQQSPPQIHHQHYQQQRRQHLELQKSQQQQKPMQLQQDQEKPREQSKEHPQTLNLQNSHDPQLVKALHIPDARQISTKSLRHEADSVGLLSHGASAGSSSWRRRPKISNWDVKPEQPALSKADCGAAVTIRTSDPSAQRSQRGSSGVQQPTVEFASFSPELLSEEESTSPVPIALAADRPAVQAHDEEDDVTAFISSFKAKYHGQEKLQRKSRFSRDADALNLPVNPQLHGEQMPAVESCCQPVECSMFPHDFVDPRLQPGWPHDGAFNQPMAVCSGVGNESGCAVVQIQQHGGSFNASVEDCQSGFVLDQTFAPKFAQQLAPLANLDDLFQMSTTLEEIEGLRSQRGRAGRKSSRFGREIVLGQSGEFEEVEHRSRSVDAPRIPFQGNLGEDGEVGESIWTSMSYVASGDAAFVPSADHNWDQQRYDHQAFESVAETGLLMQQEEMMMQPTHIMLMNNMNNIGQSHEMRNLDHSYLNHISNVHDMGHASSVQNMGHMMQMDHMGHISGLEGMDPSNRLGSVDGFGHNHMHSLRADQFGYINNVGEMGNLSQMDHVTHISCAPNAGMAIEMSIPNTVHSQQWPLMETPRPFPVEQLFERDLHRSNPGVQHYLGKHIRLGGFKKRAKRSVKPSGLSDDGPEEGELEE